MFITFFTNCRKLIKKCCRPTFGKSIISLIPGTLLTAGLFMQSCVTCPDNRGNSVKVSFFNQGIALPIQPYNKVYLQERDSFLSFDGNTLKLDVERNQSTYILSNTDNTLSDTIVFLYKSSIEYLDRECGIQFEITDFQVNSSFREEQLINVDEKINEWEINFFR